MYTRPSLDIRFLNNDGIVCYGIERFLSKLDYKIRKNPQMYEELRKLLTAGWTNDDFTMPSTLHVLHIWNPNKLTNINDLYSDLKRNWGIGGEGQLRSFHKLNNCLNERTGKPNDVYLYQKGRAKLLREMKKTGKRPKQSTIEKYKITFEEILDIKKMPEEQLVMDERLGIIYKISSPSGKVYVGQTVRSFEKRVAEHKSKFSGCTLLKKAINKYGDEMNYEIIEGGIPQEHLDEKENYWINHFNSLAPSGYNLMTGGHYERGYTQEAKDNMRNAVLKVKIEKNGYLGGVELHGNLFYPRARNNCNQNWLSNGGFRTEEECIEVLQEYTKDPYNFIKVDSPYKRKDGSVLKKLKKWSVKYKNVYLGDYQTEEEGWEAIEKYQKDPENFTKPERITTGHIFKRGNRWNISYKGKFLGSYDTEKKAYTALEEYKKDPKKFIKGRRKANGSIFKSGDKWRFNYKKKHIGYYATREEAEEARETLQSSL
jgi:group I intron endonuclease